MSEPIPSLSAPTITEQAAIWLERREAKGWTAEDACALDAWLEQSESHSAAFWRLEAAWEQTSRLAALGSNRPALPNKPSAAQRKWPMVLRLVAATVVVAAVGAAAKVYFAAPQGQLYTTPVGGREILTLADGSQIELNTDTSLRVNFDSKRRAVSLLRGEAYFQVRHNAARPFVVTAGKHRVIDLGTKFLVRERPNQLEVSLIEGRARVEAINGGAAARPADLSPGDVAIATASGVNLQKKSHQQLKDEAAWRRGVLVFDQTRLADAVAEFNRYNQTKLVVEDRVAAEKTLGGTFPINDIEDFTHLTETVLGLHVRRRGDRIVISH